MGGGEAIDELARDLVHALIRAGRTVATAESCTGGWIAKALTDVSGSSQCFGYGIVSYSNAAKTELLGVSTATLARDGAVSEAVVREMAAGVLDVAGADLAVAVSGIAGPDGGSPDKPVGTVWFAWQRRGHPALVRCERFDGDRDRVRRRTVALALQGLIEELGNGG